ncbi:type 1 secretion target domain-containng protein [Enterobacter cloacae]|uniref:Type 1 secretion target domain-containng protein n=1 Tax=Enterobacter cloacae TaxID=550 RepID=A0A377M379_ENTCL|nr:type 1 secretion target domain-containng protein [Enterobacter cloacae]
MDVVVNTVTPEIAINTLAADDVINATEKGEDLLLSGTSNQPEGTTIAVSLNGITYTATTDASGNWECHRACLCGQRAGRGTLHRDCQRHRTAWATAPQPRTMCWWTARCRL